MASLLFLFLPLFLIVRTLTELPRSAWHALCNNVHMCGLSFSLPFHYKYRRHLQELFPVQGKPLSYRLILNPSTALGTSTTLPAYSVVCSQFLLMEIEPP